MDIDHHQLPQPEFRQPSGGMDGFKISAIHNLSGRSRVRFNSDRSHRHAFYEVRYYSSGKGRYCIDFEQYPCRPPVLFFVSPGQIHYWEWAKEIRGYALLFTEDFLLKAPSGHALIFELDCFNSVLPQPGRHLSKDQRTVVDAAFSTMLTEYDADRFAKDAMLSALLGILLVKVQRMAEATRQSGGGAGGASLVRRFKRLISKSHFRHRALQYYADQLGVGRGRLSRTVKSVAGLPPGRVIRQEVALEAKRLLIHTELSAAEIGFRLGFDDPSHFGRFFKHETGHRPYQYRSRHQENYPLFPE